MIPFLTPRYLKKAKLLSKGVKRWLHYKEDLLSSDQLATVRRLGEELKVGIKAKNKEQVENVSAKLADACVEAVPPSENSKIGENVEVIFVALVVVFGFKAFFLKPFRIPTGSMQPTLNGIIATPVREWGDEATLWTEQDQEVIERPGIGKRIVDRFLFGTRYLDVVAEKGGTLVRPKVKTPNGQVVEGDYWQEVPGINFLNVIKLSLVTKAQALLADGSKLNVPVPKHVAIDPGSPFDLQRRFADGRVEEGEVIARGKVRAGDYVVVNRFAYHFRRPHRGEVFVFSTRDIPGIQLQDRRWGAIHYIKRLAGLPNDRLEIEIPEGAESSHRPVGQLNVNGRPAEEPGFRKVMSGENFYRGYNRYGPPIRLGEKQYAALGDNSYNSRDSRHWGAVPERNLVGPGSLVLWPLGPHWGFVK